MPRFRTSWPFAIAGLLAALALSVAPAVSETPRKGGALRIGMIGEPPTLDAHVTTATNSTGTVLVIYDGKLDLNGFTLKPSGGGGLTIVFSGS